MWFWRFRRFVWRAACIIRISCMLSCFYVWISVGRGGRRWAAPGPLLGPSWAALGRPLGGSWAASGLSWGLLGLLLDRVWAPARVLLLAAPGCSWALLAAPGCSWRLVAAPGRSWPLLAAHGRSWPRLPVRRRRGRGVAAISSPSWLLVPAAARFLTQVYVHMRFLFVTSYT